MRSDATVASCTGPWPDRRQPWNDGKSCGGNSCKPWSGRSCKPWSGKRYKPWSGKRYKPWSGDSCKACTGGKRPWTGGEPWRGETSWKRCGCEPCSACGDGSWGDASSGAEAATSGAPHGGAGSAPSFSEEGFVDGDPSLDGRGSNNPRSVEDTLRGGRPRLPRRSVPGRLGPKKGSPGFCSACGPPSSLHVRFAVLPRRAPELADNSPAVVPTAGLGARCLGIYIYIYICAYLYNI